MKLCDISPGETAKVEKLLMTDAMRRRLMDLGLVENTLVECVGDSPGGDLKAYLIRGAVIALRSKDSSNILVYA